MADTKSETTVATSKAQTVITFEGMHFTPAGYRVPEIGEYYVSRTGWVIKRFYHAPDGPRLIVREVALVPVEVTRGAH